MTDAQPITPFKLALTAFSLVLWPAVLMTLAGDWRWPAGWLLGLWFVASCAGMLLWLYRHDPELLAERYRRPGTGGQSRRDQWTIHLIGIGFLVWLALMPLDARRFHWTPPLAWPLRFAGALLMALGSLLVFRSFKDNPFTSPLVRIQRERGHHLVSTGVYGLVRHPMYLGASLIFAGAPLVVGAASGLVAGAALVALLVVRIFDEERLLATSLPGYDAYRKRVRHRLVPGIW